jgi:RES domain-containing protein
MLHGGRWNSVGQRVIYAAESYAGAMLEVFVHASLSVPPKNHRVVRISVPDQVKIETVTPTIWLARRYPESAYSPAPQADAVELSVFAEGLVITKTASPRKGILDFCATPTDQHSNGLSDGITSVHLGQSRNGSLGEF